MSCWIFTYSSEMFSLVASSRSLATGESVSLEGKDEHRRRRSRWITWRARISLIWLVQLRKELRKDSKRVKKLFNSFWTRWSKNDEDDWRGKGIDLIDLGNLPGNARPNWRWERERRCPVCSLDLSFPLTSARIWTNVVSARVKRDWTEILEIWSIQSSSSSSTSEDSAFVEARCMPTETRPHYPMNAVTFLRCDSLVRSRPPVEQQTLLRLRLLSDDWLEEEFHRHRNDCDPFRRDPTVNTMPVDSIVSTWHFSSFDVRSTVFVRCDRTAMHRIID